MAIVLKRVFDPPAVGDGYRVLVDRLWPRGISKEQLVIDDWMKVIAPSHELRKSFHSGELTWGEFRAGYLAELKMVRDKLRPLVDIANKGRLTLVYSSRNETHNNAVVVMQYLRMLGAYR